MPRGPNRASSRPRITFAARTSCCGARIDGRDTSVVALIPSAMLRWICARTRGRVKFASVVNRQCESSRRCRMLRCGRSGLR